MRVLPTCTHMFVCMHVRCRKHPEGSIRSPGTELRQLRATVLVLAAELGPLPEQDVLLRHLSRPINIIHIRAVLTSSIFAPHFFSSQHNLVKRASFPLPSLQWMKSTQLTGIKYCLCATQGIERDSPKQSDSDLLKVQGNVWPDGARTTKSQTLISWCAGVGALPAGSGISRSSVSCLGRDYL